MSVVQEAQYDQEQSQLPVIPEAQLLERPLTIMDGLQQAAREGFVPQVADAISIAHLPNPGFTIKHEFNPDTKIEPNDGKAAIVAGICGVTKTCADRCCPIGDLDKARVRVELINELKLNDPDFFNNPDANKIIKERVNERMAQKQSSNNTESIIVNRSSSQDDTQLTTDKIDVESPAEQKKPKTELPWNKKITPEEEKKNMEALSGTYSQGKKVEPSITTPKVETSQTAKPVQTEFQSPVDTPQSVSENKVEKVQPEIPIISPSTQERPVHIAERPIDVQKSLSLPDKSIIIPDQISARIKEQVEILNPTKAPKTEITAEHLVSKSQEVYIKKPTIEIKPIETPTLPIEPETLSQEVIPQIVPQVRIDRHRPKTEVPKIIPIEQLPPPIIESILIPKPEVTISTVFTPPIQEIRTDEVTIKTQEIEVSQFVEDTIQIPSSSRQIAFEKLQDTKKPTPAEHLELVMQIPQVEFTSTPQKIVEDIQPFDTSQIRVNVAPSISVSQDPVVKMPVTQTEHVQVKVNESAILQTQEAIVQQIDEPIRTAQQESRQVPDTQLVIEKTSTITETIQVVSSDPTGTSEGHSDVVHIKEEPTTIFSYFEQVVDATNDVIQIQDTNDSELKIKSVETEIQPTTFTQTVEQVITTVEVKQTSKLSLDNTEITIAPITENAFTQLLNTLVVESKENPKQIMQLEESVPTTETMIISPTETNEFHTSQNEIPTIDIEALPEELRQKIEELVVESEVTPVLVLALSQSNQILNEIPTESIVKKTVETPISQPEIFLIQFLNQEEVLHFTYLIQNITDILSFLHNTTKENNDVIDEANFVREMQTTDKELRNDTFGNYDDTVVVTLWPIIQFMLYIQRMQIFIPQNQ